VLALSRPWTLADLPKIGLGRVRAVPGNGPIATRLRELGFTPGTEVAFVRQAPFGGPMVVDLRGYQLCLRPTEARLILVESPAEPS
jgi:ferrous iron transport protein A